MRIEKIILERVLSLVGLKLGEIQTRIRELRMLAEMRGPQHQLVVIIQLAGPFEVHIIKTAMHVVTRTVGLLVIDVGDGTVTRHHQMAVQVTTRTTCETNEAAEFTLRLRCDVVDHTTRRLRAEADHLTALADLDRFIAINGRVVIAGVVAIRGERQGQPVFQQQGLGRSRRVQSPHSDVGTQSHALFLAHMDARHFAQGFIDIEHTAFFQRARINHCR